MSYWDRFYKNNPPEKTPWDGVQEIFFEKVWKRFNFPTKGNLLDVGCGRGGKAIHFAKEGYKVWAFDISPTAIKEAEDKTKGMTNPPTLFVADASKLDESEEIKDIEFDVVIDLVTSQFLDKKEKLSYLKDLSNHINPKTHYLMSTFIKDNEEDEMEGYMEWVKKIAQSPKDIEETYLKYFKLEDKLVRLSPKGKVGTYIFKTE